MDWIKSIWNSMDEGQRVLFMSQLGSNVRRILVLVAGFMLAHTGIDLLPFLGSILNRTNAAIGALAIFAATTIWSTRKNFHWSRRVDIAHDADPKVTTRAEIEDKLRAELKSS